MAEPQPKVYYTCDPDKNVQCNRKNCGIKPIIPNMPGPCTHTTRLECAKQPVEVVKLVLPMSQVDFDKLQEE